LGKLYEFSGGQLRLASIMPDGTPAAEPVYYLPNTEQSTMQHMISRDGSRIFFSVGGYPYGTAGAFVREHGQTRPISVSHRVGDGPEVHAGFVNDASADGSVVYFTSDTPLTDTSVGAGAYLYRYDLTTDTLTHIVDLVGYAVYYPGLAASADGQRFYFHSDLKLTPTAVEGAYNVYVWHNDQLQLVVAETGAGAGQGGAGGAIGVYGTGGTGTDFRLSPDGRLALFTAFVKTPEYDNVNTAVCLSLSGNARPSGNLCQKLYFFDPDDGGAQCVSCNTTGARTAGDAQLSQGDGRSVTDDGRVFFNSPDRLVPGDVNGKYDAYQWRDGDLSLISTGTSNDDSAFVNASDDGRDVFFVTGQQLVGQDTDNVRDIYDAREGGGLPGQARAKASPSCSDDDCQLPASSQPALASIGTVTFTGPGSTPAGAAAGVAGRVSVAKPEMVKGASGLLKVRAPGKGRLTVSGAGVATAKRTVTKAGTVSLRIALTAKGRLTLMKKHRFRTTVRAVFVPSVGAASTVKVALTFSVPATKKKEGR
jgi:hypothetical protein